MNANPKDSALNVSVHFSQMNLPEPVAKAVAKMGFTEPTPIQQKAIPLILKGSDTVSLAETGSGKTAAYLIPLFSQLLAQPDARALVLVPTRELAVQIGEVASQLTCFARELRFAVAIGGISLHQQARSLQSQPRLIIATPGRLMDHVRRRSVDLRKINKLILDEADRMFDMGFAPQVNAIVKQIPTKRQTLLFSATFPNEIRSLAHRVLHKPVEIEVRRNQLPPKAIRQKMIPLHAAEKNDHTLDLINAATGLVIVFTRTKHRTDRLFRYLEEYGVPVTRIHGDRTQAQRTTSISGFREGRFRVMVATDIAARGLDVSDISDVINYDVPMSAEDYVHRIGRTGRAGQDGQALTLVSPEEGKNWSFIAKKMGLPFEPLKRQSNKPPQRPHRPDSAKWTRGQLDRRSK